ncbi:MAG: hypothetical protein AAGJ40_09670 [Planctomycetota bacterium]
MSNANQTPFDPNLLKFATPRARRTLGVWLEHGSSRKAAAALGIGKTTLSDHLSRTRAAARAAGYVEQLSQRAALGEHILEAAAAGGIAEPSDLKHYWKIVKDETGNGYSLFVRNPEFAGDQEFSITEMVRQAVEEGIGDSPPRYERRKKEPKGERLLVIDLADIHFMKLSVRSETGYEYNREVTRHRVIEGTKALLGEVDMKKVGRILFVMGNDILHVDNSRKTTTSGTPQDTDGTIFDGFKDAHRAIVDAIEVCARHADVDLVHCMSNHDWIMGWALSQSVAAHLRHHPHVHATAYGLSEHHRKYYRFGSNLIGLTHGDGAKEEKLYGLMVKEARQHIGECKNLYWLLHHMHHKMRRKRNGEVVIQTEKDHNGMTAIVAGTPDIEGDYLKIEYVRSPSPPDGWHSRNGYENRQGVECFVFHPHDGQKARFTEWF